VPYKCEKLKLKHEQNRRVKLTVEQRQEILSLKGAVSQRQLANDYGVDRRTISFIHSPEALEENKKRRAERGGSKIYYDKEKNTKAVRETRQYKQGLYLKGELCE